MFRRGGFNGNEENEGQGYDVYFTPVERGAEKDITDKIHVTAIPMMFRGTSSLMIHIFCGRARDVSDKNSSKIFFFRDNR